MSHYKKHLIFCTNQRDNGRQCCQDGNAQAISDYAKQQVKALNAKLSEKRFRVNTTSCLGRCALGPSLVVYPDGIWYRYHNEADIDEIIEQHLLQDKPVARLFMEESV